MRSFLILPLYVSQIYLSLCSCEQIKTNETRIVQEILKHRDHEAVRRKEQAKFLQVLR
jgi:hypothetical protein